MIDRILERAKARRAWQHERPADMARLVRRRAGLTQGEIASVLGVDRSAVSRWEAGERTPRPEVMTRYRELLDRLQAAETE